MQLSTERIELGVRRLLGAPKDVKRWDAQLVDPGPEGASQAHSRLYRTYIAAVETASADAERAWDAETEARTQLTGDRSQALREQWTTFPAGPAAEPVFVALIRRFWLACDELNKSTPTGAVPPEVFLVGWPAAEKPSTETVIRVLSCMPYWPLGLDEKGNWL